MELSNTHQTTTNRQNKRTKIEEHHSDCESIEKVKKALIFKLPWQSRDSLIIGLNKYSAVFYSNSVNCDFVASLIRENQNFIKILSNSKAKDDKFQGVTFLSVDTNITTDSLNLPELEISCSLRERLFNSLVSNHNSVIHLKTIQEQFKKNLIEENTSLVHHLMKLKVVVNDENDTNGDRRLSSQNTADQLTNGSKNNLKYFNDEQSNKILEIVDRKLTDLKNVLVYDFTRAFNDRPEVNYTFCITDLTNFLKVPGNARCSTVLIVRNLPFFIRVQNKFHSTSDNDLEGYLEVIIQGNYDPKDKCTYYVKNEYRLLSHTDAINDHVARFGFKFDRKLGFTLPKFISHSSLLDESLGYLDKDSITIRINLYVIAEKEEEINEI